MAVVMPPRIDVDLSYLNEQEQETIRAVIDRDELEHQQLVQRIESVNQSSSCIFGLLYCIFGLFQSI